MKKIGKMLAACGIAMMMLAVPVCAEEVDVTGDWYGDYMGAVMKMTINEDGTFKVDFGGEISEGTWEMTEEGLQMDDALFTVTEEGLVGTDEEFQITFGREVLENFVPAEIDYEADLELLQGKWSAYKMGANGTYMDVDAENESYMEMEITGTTVMMDGFYFEGGVTYEMTQQDGGLSLFFSDESDMFQIIAINYLTDGTVRLALVDSVEEDGETFEYFFVAAEEETETEAETEAEVETEAEAETEIETETTAD